MESSKNITSMNFTFRDQNFKLDVNSYLLLGILGVGALGTYLAFNKARKTI
jgi:hypothetical protein